MMDLRLSGRVALVTGASRGLGRAIALRLAQEGMHVALAARDAARLEAVAREISAHGVEALPLVADLSQTASAARVIGEVMQRFKKLNLLVNNAGATKRGDFLALSDADWADGFALKFFGAMRLARAAWPHLGASRGMILNIGGIGGRTGEAEFAIGGSVNAAIGLVTKALADRGVQDGIRVLAIHPGTFETDRFVRRLKAHMTEHGLSADEARRSMLKEQGIARFGRPEELANLIAMLASDHVEFLQGSIIDMDGGQTRTV
jgi:NAD(P)-dependent dehydrogenase (short-subunit alcohol dehydrogenase family)